MDINDFKDKTKGFVFYENIEGKCTEIKIISELSYIPKNRDLFTEIIKFRGITDEGKIYIYQIWFSLKYYGLYKNKRPDRLVDWSHKNIANPSILPYSIF